jgi:thiamine phosphate synthase YjbQ (UPF0047 family)
MFYSTKAYLNASGQGQVLNLTHDVKRGLADAKIASGLVNILSMQATTSVLLIESDENLQKGLFEHTKALFPDAKGASPARRSGTGADRYHFMAASLGLSVTLPFTGGRLSGSSFQDIVAFDFEPKAGRREFVITIIGDAAGNPK